MISGINGANLGMQDVAEMRARMFKRMDQDGDGKITKEEMTAAMPPDDQQVQGTSSRPPSVDEIFSQADANQDGAIDESENEAFLKQMPAGPPPGRPPGQQDASAMAKALFEKADGDTDGKITLDELSEALPQTDEGASLADLLKNSDTDEDGVITESELTTFLEQLETKRREKFGGPPRTDGGNKFPQCPSCGGYDQTGEGTATSLSSQFSVLA